MGFPQAVKIIYFVNDYRTDNVIMTKVLPIAFIVPILHNSGGGVKILKSQWPHIVSSDDTCCLFIVFYLPLFCWIKQQ